jgi:acetyl-CoA carboxylase biotin carboxyl carrier protein
MNFEDIERILQLVREHDLAEFELEGEGLKLRVRKAGGAPQTAANVHLLSDAPAAAPAGPPAPPAAVLSPAAVAAPSLDAEMELAVVKSPIVGTFYRSSEPGAAALVDVGQRVKKDQVLCIIEAMKLMNEITSEYEGEVVSVFVENGKPVQYGERLFAIRTS